METEVQIDYQRIEKAIGYLKSNFRMQPTLEEVAAYVHLSSFHFQRMFTEWAGVSPKKFLQYLNIQYAKSKISSATEITLFDLAHDTGLSGTGRLHDLFIKLEGMTPGEYKNGGINLQINYSYQESTFGPLFIASTDKGICYMAFADDPEVPLQELRLRLPNASYRQATDTLQENALGIFRKDFNNLQQVKLHLKGTPFQLKIWETLLKVPSGDLVSYSGLANAANQSKACRAVASAVADNPIAYLIPCHRVIRSTGDIGQYHWGPDRKAAMIGWEAAALEFTE
ncbi:methylated-DNA--[protein]-cysteine S-methyltransferase [Pedobacter sp. BAL39]|uniref:methylated-DNA--[protein]-cysteine S-methyltransferase n=1 Tax=Pedobacter sp. BAL39 TaxID=391596 RepID=UPI0001559874|nr:methylated-DNA--[protein]-cysteine S-methyltransferase [Pedobacter sp. BAL39]EDM35000.1 methylated-DNA--[protein]-cysteine S-methyltransferase [Pedobacter sp. BAL39]